MSADLESLRLRVQEAMTLGGYTQVQVSEETNINQSTLSRFLSGRSVSSATEAQLEAWLAQQDALPLPKNSEVQAAIRLYRWMHNVIDEGGTLVIRYKDGREQAILLLM